MYTIVQRFEKKVLKFKDNNIVFNNTQKICNNWLQNSKEGSERAYLEHVLQHKLSGFSGHVFYANSVLNAISNYCKHRSGKKIVSLLWANWEFLRSLAVSDKDIIGEFSPERKKNDTLRYEKVDFCFCVSMENYLKVLLPIAQKLDDVNKKIAIITVEKAKKWIIKEKFPKNVTWIYLDDIIQDQDWFFYDDQVKKWEKKWKKEKKIIKKNMILYNPYIFIALRKRIYIIFSKMIPVVLLYGKVIERIVEQLQPEEMIVVRLRRVFDIVCEQIAKQKNIRTSLIIHGQIFENFQFFDSDGFFDTDIVYTWGAFQENILNAKAKYMQIGQCKNYGNVVWDNLFLKFASPKDELQNSICDSAEKKHVLLYLGQADSFPFFEMFIQSVISINNIIVLIKPHPYEDIEKYHQILRQYDIEARVFDRMFQNIDKLISMSDISYTYTSTTGINVMLNDKPLITLNLNNEKGIFLTENIMYSPIVSSKEELVRQTKRILIEKQYKDKILIGQREFLHSQMECNGTATVDIVNDLMERMQNDNKSY